MTATISISKIITVVNSTSVFNVKSANFVLEALKYNEITIKGWVSMKVYDKYTDMIKSNGFAESEIIYLDVKKDCSVDFKIKFKRRS